MAEIDHMKDIGVAYIDAAINELDAAMFSGDLFLDLNRALAFQKYLHRWERGLLKHMSDQVPDHDETAC